MAVTDLKFHWSFHYSPETTQEVLDNELRPPAVLHIFRRNRETDFANFFWLFLFFRVHGFRGLAGDILTVRPI